MANLDEPRRLDRLANSLLDVDPDATLDACVKEAATRLRAPIALVTLVLRHIQLFRAQVGLPPELALSRGASRSQSFCQRVIQGEVPYVVRDARDDDRIPRAFYDSYGIRAYLGVPVMLGGEIVGSLCAVDARPRDFTRADVEALESIGERVSARVAEMEREPGRVYAMSPGPVPGREAVLDMALDATVLERALRELEPVVASLSELPMGAFSDGAVTRSLDMAEQATSVYDDAVEVTHSMRHLLTLVAREVDATHVNPVSRSLGMLEQSLTEIGPLVRLVRGASTLSSEQLGRAVRLARQAMNFHDEAIRATAALREECLILADWAFRPDGPSGPSGPRGPREPGKMH